MDELLSISDAARVLHVSPGRVRAMVAHGQLPAMKIGGRWIVERSAIGERLHVASHGGRPFEPTNAWALLLLASGEAVSGVEPSVRSRLRRALRLEGIESLSARLARRAAVHAFEAHSGELRYLLDDPRVVRSGVSASPEHGFELSPGVEVDAYLVADQLDGLVSDHALTLARMGGNVKLRLVPVETWHMLEGRHVAPVAAVALDLAGDADPRLARVGRTALRQLDAERAARAAKD